MSVYSPIMVRRTNLLESKPCGGNPTSLFCIHALLGLPVKNIGANEELQEICRTCPVFAKAVEEAILGMGKRIQAEGIARKQRREGR